MKILGIDTSSKFLSFALCEDERIIVEESHLLDRKHSSLLVPKIKHMLGGLGVCIKDIDAFVIGLGPGSFTGLRIGVSTVKGFGISTKKPCVGISSLDSLALDANVEKDDLIVPVLDAKRGNVYSAIYRKEKNRIVKKSNYLLLSVYELMKRIKGEAVFLGDGINLYREEMLKLKKYAVFLEERYWYPRAGNLVKLALGKIKKYKESDLARLKPIYLYPKDCQVIR